MKLISAIGIVVVIAIAFLASTNRSAIRWSVVARALALHTLIAASVLHFSTGKDVIDSLSNGVRILIDYSSVGISMVFGELAGDSLGMIFAVHILPIIIFFSALMSVLYYLRIMPVVVSGVGWFLEKVIGTKPIPSLCAAANVFVGQTEAPLIVRPYLLRLSTAQLFSVMVSGMASVSGTILAAYAKLGVQLEYLLAASLMAAPAGLMMAWIIVPGEPEEPCESSNKDKANSPIEIASQHENVFVAAAMGAQDGMKLAASVGAMLIAFVAIIALLNGLFGGVGQMVGIDDLTMQQVLGWAFSPVMFLLGVPWQDAQIAGTVFGEKLILNEFVAYVHLMSIETTITERSLGILTFALCGFANFSSIAILLGTLGSLLPERMAEIARLGLRCVLAASLANLVSAGMAGLFL